MAGVNSDVCASGYISDGRLKIRNRRWFDEAIRRFRDGAEVDVEITIRRATRSQALNRYYWGVVIHLLSEHTGYSADELHDVLKMKFIPKRLAVCNGNGEIVGEYVMGGSTRRMTNREFQDYLSAIRQWAAEQLDCNIPEPHEGAL